MSTIGEVFSLSAVHVGDKQSTIAPLPGSVSLNLHTFGENELKVNALLASHCHEVYRQISSNGPTVQQSNG